MGWRLACRRVVVVVVVAPGDRRRWAPSPRAFPFHSSSSSTSNGRDCTRRFPPPRSTRSRLPPEGTAHLEPLPYPLPLCFCLRYLSHSSQGRPGLARVSVGGKKPAVDSRRAGKFSGPRLPVEKLEAIVDIVEADGEDMELRLNRLNPGRSLAMFKDVVRVMNHLRVRSLRFFQWFVSSARSSPLDTESYNLVVDNLGFVEDFESMFHFLKGLSQRGHCLTEQAFTFVAVSTGSDGAKDLIRRVVVILNGVEGSCRGSGIHSLIKLLCGCGNVELALSMIKETPTRASHCNVIISAKCRQGDFQGAIDMLVEMRRLGCIPTADSYNYLLGSLFKNKRFDEGCDLLQAMEGVGLQPDQVTFEVMVFHACKFKSTDLAMEFINKMVLGGLQPRFTTHAVVIKSYFHSGRVSDACRYVMDMSIRDCYSSNMNYSLLARLFWASRRPVEASGILGEMMEKGLKPNFAIYIKIVRDLHKLGMRDLALELKSKFSKFHSPSCTR